MYHISIKIKRIKIETHPIANSFLPALLSVKDEFPFDVAGKRGWTVEGYSEEVVVCEFGWVVEEFDVLKVCLFVFLVCQFWFLVLERMGWSLP